MSKRKEDVQKWLGWVREDRARLRQQISAIQQDKHLTDEGKQARIAQLRQTNAADVHSRAQSAWFSVTNHREELQAERKQRLQAKEQGWDYAKLQFLKDEINSQLSGHVASGGPFGAQGPLERAAALHKQYSAAEDKHALRALKAAVAPLLAADHRPDTAEGQAAGNLRRALEDDESRENADLTALDAEGRELASLQAALKFEIQNLEHDATGVGVHPSGAMGGGGSPWTASVFKEGDGKTDKEIVGDLYRTSHGGAPFAPAPTGVQQ